MRVTKTTVSRSTIGAATILMAAAWGATPARADTNIILNGGFETFGSDPTIASNWNNQSTEVARDTTMPHTGTADEYLNNTFPASAAYLFQDTPAGSVTPGSVYTLSFYSAGTFAAGGIGQYQVAYFSQNSGPTGFSGIQVFFPGSSYTNTTFVLPAAPANTSYAEVQFYAVTGGDNNSVAQMHLDDVTLTAPGVVTGGATAWAVAGSGDWNVATNWTAGVPNGVGAEADLFSSITAAHTVYTDLPITLGTLNFNNTNQYVVSGAGSLTMQASSGSASIIVQAGTQKLALPLTIASNTTLNVSSGATLLVSNPVTINAGDAVTTTGTGTVTYQSNVTLGSGASLALAGSTSMHALALGSNATTVVGTTGTTTRQLLQTSSLSLGTGSSLNLTDSDLIVHGGSLSAISSAIGTGYSNGTWTGTGITSSTAAVDSKHLTALGSAQVSTAGTFDGAAVNPGDVVVRYTYFGDANLDGKVDGSDYSRIDAGYAAHGSVSGWSNGDFNYDGTIDGSDYTLVDNAFNNQSGQIAAAQTVVAAVQAGAVPEPASIALIGFAAMTLIGRRRPGRISSSV